MYSSQEQGHVVVMQLKLRMLIEVCCMERTSCSADMPAPSLTLCISNLGNAAEASSMIWDQSLSTEGDT